MAITPDTTYTSPCRFDWGVVVAGAVVASALSIVLMQFGAIIGLSADSPLRGEGSDASWSLVATGIWILWIQLLASLAGGYIAGFLRSPTIHLTAYENEIRDGLHGLTVWAVSTVGVFIAVSIAAGLSAYVEVNTTSNIAPDALTDAEENTAIIFAFVIGAVSLLSAVAAWWAATMGGDHRDKKVDFSTHLSFK